MNVVAYYEGSDSVCDWIRKLVGQEVTFKKLPQSNYSNDFAELPAYVSDILYLDKPDVILAGNQDGVHEKPIFSIEFASCTPQYQHALQRFSRMVASVVGGCPSALVMPMRKNENDGGVRCYNRSRAIEYGAVRLMDTYRIPTFVFDWPDSEGQLENEPNSDYPKLDSTSMQELGAFLRKAISTFNDSDYIGSLWRLAEARVLTEKTRERAYAVGAPTIEKPGGGVGEGASSKLDLVETKWLLNDILNKIPDSKSILSQLPEFIVNREKSLVFYPTRFTAHAGDPYVGMVSYYDIAFCRVGPTTRDRHCNLVAFANSVSISELQKVMESFNSKRCPFSKPVSAKNVTLYCYHLRYGCREMKIKPVRIYSELADITVFKDGLIFNVG